MRTVFKTLGLILLGSVLKVILEPVLGPVLAPTLPTASTLIQSTMTRTNEALFTTAIRYAAAGYREPGDVLLTTVSLLALCSVIIGAMFGLARLPRPIEPPRKGYVLGALILVVTPMFAYILWVHATELQSRTTAMQMHKIYQRNMATLAPYISPQEARELGSSWARMETRADLQAMDARFLTLFQQHGLASGGPPTAPSQ